MLRGQRRTHIGMESSSLFSLNLLQYLNKAVKLERTLSSCVKLSADDVTLIPLKSRTLYVRRNFPNSNVNIYIRPLLESKCCYSI